MSKRKSQTPEAVEQMLMDTRVALPAIVINYIEETLAADVLPAIRGRKMADGRELEYEPMHVIGEVPVADVAGVRFVPKPGDHGMLIFQDFDIQAYTAERDITDPHTSRFHDYSDAVFLPFEFAHYGRPEQPKIVIYSEDNAIGVYANEVVINAPTNLIFNGISWDDHIHLTPFGPSGPPQ